MTTSLLPICILLAAAVGNRAFSFSLKSLSPISIKDSPWFCHDLDCPVYEVLAEIDDDIEKRHYPAGKWASTILADVKYEDALHKGFMRLFSYISGANEDSAKIDMTAPVKVELTPGQGPFCKSSFKVSFFVPFVHQASPPVPTNPNVFIEEMPASEFYVMSYGGWSSESKVLDAAAQIVFNLKTQGYGFNATTFFFAGYDSPFRIIFRHNEVWIPADDDETPGHRRVQQLSVAS